jgi:hypothetical protein
MGFRRIAYRADSTHHLTAANQTRLSAKQRRMYDLETLAFSPSPSQAEDFCGLGEWYERNGTMGKRMETTASYKLTI